MVNSKGWTTPRSPAVPKNRAMTDQIMAAVVPTEMSVSIVAAPCLRFIQAALWNGHPAQTTTGAAKVREAKPQ